MFSNSRFSESCFWLNVAGLVSLTFSLLLLAWVHVFERLAEWEFYHVVNVTITRLFQFLRR